MSSTVICLHRGGFTSRPWKRLATHHAIAPDLFGDGAEPLIEAAIVEHVCAS